MSRVRVGIADDNKDFCNILADFLKCNKILTLYLQRVMECKLLMLS